MVVFDEEGSFTFDKMTWEMTQPRRELGNFMFDVWISPGSATRSFHRQ